MSEGQTETPSRNQDNDTFPEFDTEYETVTGLENRMETARDEWEPPETPTYDSNSDARPALRSGTIRSLDETTENGETVLLFGVDTGEDDNLVWVEVTDSGERSLTNPYVRFCKMYNVHPANPQDFYNTEIEFRTRYDTTKPFICPYFLPLRLLWAGWWMPHSRYKLWNIKSKEMGTGRVPTWRFFPAYIFAFGVLKGGFALNELVLGGTFGGALVYTALVIPMILFFLTTLWGIICKIQNDIRPYVGELLKYTATMYAHRNG